MRADYHISREKLKTDTQPAAEYFLDIQCLMIRDERRNGLSPTVGTRNLLTRTIDSLIALVRKYAPPIHWVGAALLAVTLFSYVRLVVLTSRLYPIGERVWPDVPAPGVIVLWHRDAPSLLVAFAIRKPASPSYIMISTDPRGDSLALLCRMLGFQTVRGGGDEGGWEALVELSDVIANGASVFVTADGGGPARVVKVGALALASAASVPLLALSADSYPAIEESRKWDAARNPLPFSSIFVSMGPTQVFERFNNVSSLNEAMAWLKQALDRLASDLAALRSS